MYSSYNRRSQPQPHDNKQPQQDKPQQPEPVAQVEPEKPKKQPGMLDLLMENKDQSLILLLLVILMKDGADLNLVLALIYLLI